MPTVLPIDRKIGIQREDHMMVKQFGHPHEAGVGQGHRLIAIFPVERSKGRDVLIDMQGKVQGPISQQSPHGVLGPGQTRE